MRGKLWLWVLLCGAWLAPAVAAPPRLVALAPHITELVYAAGAGANLVGVAEYSDYPAAALQLPRVGDAYRVDYETLRRLEPDIVVAWESGNPREVLDRLREQGFRVVTLEARTLDDVAEHLELIGALAHTEAQAAAAAAAYRERLRALRAQYRDSDRVSVFYQIAAEPYFTVSGDHVISRIIELCGGNNVFADVPGLAPAVTLEAIVAANPQVILAGSNADWRSAWRRWPTVRAVAANALYAVDPDLLARSGPRLVAGAEQVCAALATARRAAAAGPVARP
ncbi:MAG: cobalamin-binding protein [Gammaproteobacteria bacterium]|jgi:iron complex transport system substrate-binding protein|nr:cobalamin-binding protein [Gammaproteobacteria bacterium]